MTNEKLVQFLRNNSPAARGLAETEDHIRHERRIPSRTALHAENTRIFRTPRPVIDVFGDGPAASQAAAEFVKKGYLAIVRGKGNRPGQEASLMISSLLPDHENTARGAALQVAKNLTNPGIMYIPNSNIARKDIPGIVQGDHAAAAVLAIGGQENGNPFVDYRNRGVLKSRNVIRRVNTTVYDEKPLRISAAGLPHPEKGSRLRVFVQGAGKVVEDATGAVRGVQGTEMMAEAGLPVEKVDIQRMFKPGPGVGKAEGFFTNLSEVMDISQDELKKRLGRVTVVHRGRDADFSWDDVARPYKVEAEKWIGLDRHAQKVFSGIQKAHPSWSHEQSLDYFVKKELPSFRKHMKDVVAEHAHGFGLDIMTHHTVVAVKPQTEGDLLITLKNTETGKTKTMRTDVYISSLGSQPITARSLATLTTAVGVPTRAAGMTISTRGKVADGVISGTQTAKELDVVVKERDGKPLDHKVYEAVVSSAKNEQQRVGSTGNAVARLVKYNTPHFIRPWTRVEVNEPERQQVAIG